MKCHSPCNNEKGLVLISSLLFMAIVAILGSSAYFSSSNELKISSNYHSTKQALYDADAGVNYTLASVEASLSDSSLDLSGDTVTVNFTAPSGFSFNPVTTLTKVAGTTNYRFQVTGNAGSGNTTLDVVFMRDPAMTYGLFGDDELDLKASAHVYSYDSGTTPSPGPSDTTHEGDVGSNKKVIVHNGTDIDGDIGVGEESDGSDGEIAASGTPVVYGDTTDVSRVDPDPLGVVGGSLANDFVTYAASNDNASAGIVANEIDLGNGDSMTLTAGNYYLSELTIDNGGTLTIDSSAGPVNIYLTGGLEAKNGSNLNVTGAPSNFTIYSNSTDNIVFKHGSTFKGTVYAPLATIEMKNSADAFGILWGNKVDIKNSGEFYFDTALKNKWHANTVSVLSWKDTRY